MSKFLNRPAISTIMLAGALVAGSAFAGKPAPIDSRVSLPADAFQKSEPGVWLTEPQTAPFPFDELIYSWQVLLPETEGFRLYLQVGFEDSQQSPWLYAGYWGDVSLSQDKRENPSFEFGYIAMDQLLLDKKASTWQFKLEDHGKSPLSLFPELTVLTTDNEPSPAMAMEFRRKPSSTYYPPIFLDLPYRAQADSLGNPTPDRCQSAAVATAMEYFGTPLPLEKIIPLTNDPEYQYPGIWPRTIGTATQMGFTGYIDRFRDWQSVRQTLAEGKVILCSISMVNSGPWIAPPYKGTVGGHIVVLSGITDDGRVFITDSAFKPEKGTLSQWLMLDFEKAWMTSKGGVGMVICPPDGFEMRLVDEIPEFPMEQIRSPEPTKDDQPAGS